MGIVSEATDAERCLVEQHHIAQCRYCEESCPADAIVRDGFRPRVNPEACKGCGLCMAICPMEVYHARDWQADWLPANLDELLARTSAERRVMTAKTRGATSTVPAVPTTPAAPLCITCKRNTCSHAQYHTEACLGAFASGVLAQVAWSADVELDVTTCENCEVSAGLSLLEAHVFLANSWLEEAGRASRIRLVESDPTSRGGRRVRRRCDAMPAYKPPTGFAFHQIPFYAGAGKELAPLGEQPRQKIDDPALGRKRLRVPHVPQEQRRVMKLLGQSRAPARITLPDYRVDPARCWACGMCAQYCPTGALKQVAHVSAAAAAVAAAAGTGAGALGATEAGGEGAATTLTFSFLPGYCANCGLCALSCPGEAIAREFEKAAPTGERVVLELPVVVCEKCGGYTPAAKGTVCSWCQNQADFSHIIDAARVAGAAETGGEVQAAREAPAAQVAAAAETAGARP